LSALPLSLRVYGASDYATMQAEYGKRDPDFTEHGVCGIDHAFNMWILDWWFKQCETDVGIKAFLRLVSMWKPIRWFNEGGLIDKAIGPTIRAEMRRTQTFTSIEPLPAMVDKEVKLQAFHARATSGTVYFPIRRKWSDHVIDQLCKFPGGKHDDAADVCGLLGRGVDKMFAANLPYTKPKDVLIPFTEKWLETKYWTDKPKQRYFS
jgi:predicted phage terminase large subunit-like protein